MIPDPGYPPRGRHGNPKNRGPDPAVEPITHGCADGNFYSAPREGNDVQAALVKVRWGSCFLNRL